MPSPGPSFVRTEPLRLRDRDREPGPRVQLGMARPSIMEDGWWLTSLWAEDPAGVVPALAVAPPSGPPPGPPLGVIGPALAGSLAGLLAQEAERQLIRLRMPPAPDEGRPWERPLMLWVAVRWDPVRASTMSENELAAELMRAFRAAVLAAGSPS
ncbi:hypothetical protein BH23CHL8_BH23CHL8_30930 [soil metagenome]